MTAGLGRGDADRSTFHRGQVVTLLRQLAAAPPATDLVVWDRGA